MVLGTPAFMAPEQALAKSNEIDAQTDVWAAAATLFTLVSGQLVHRGDNAQQLLVSSATTRARPLSTIAPDVPDAIARIVDQGLAFERSARWQSAQAMRQALQQASVSAYGEPPTRTLLHNLTASISGAGAHSGTEVLQPNALEPAPAAMPVAPLPSRWPGSGTTSQGVATASTRTSQAPRRTRRRIGRGAVLAIVAAIGAAIGATSWMSMIGSAPSVSSAQPIVPRVPAAAAPTSLPTPGTEAPPVAPTLAATPLLDPQGSTSGAPLASSVPGAASRTRAPVTRPPPAATHARPSPNCTPPFTIDSAGHRVPKAECL
jgi:serine/threonine-protein kinase